MNQALKNEIGTLSSSSVMPTGNKQVVVQPKKNSGLAILEKHMKKKSVSQQIRKKKSQSALQFYKELCSKLNCTINTTISHGLKGGQLNLNVDNFLITDLSPLKVLLRECEFEMISLQGNKDFDAQGFHDAHKLFTMNYRNDSTENSRRESLKDQIPSNEKLAKNETNNSSSRSVTSRSKRNFCKNHQKEFIGFMESIGESLSKHPNLKIVKLTNIELTAKSLSAFCIGLEKSSSVKELYIQNCNLTTQAIEKSLLLHMKNIKSLVLLDLSFNKLDGQSGGIIGNLLSAHARNRDEHIWLCGLRGEVPQNDINIEGICEVNLMGNYLTDTSIQDLCFFLRNDGWTRSVNLRFNQIGASGLIELNNMLETNENLISLDIRNNPGMTPSDGDYMRFGEGVKLLSKSIYDKLVRNIKLFKHKRELMRKKQQEQLINNLSYENNQIQLPNIHYQLNQFQLGQQPQLTEEEQLMYARQQQEQLQLLQQQYQQHQNVLFNQQTQQQDYQLPFNQHFPHQQFQQLPFNFQQHNTVQGQNNEDQAQEEYYQDQGYKEYQEQQQQQQEDEGGEGEEGEGEEGEGDLELAGQQYVLSEEFLQIQTQHFIELYGQSEEFLSISPEDQQEVFQQFLILQQQEYLVELSKHQQGQIQEMEGVEELLEENYEEEEEHPPNEQESQKDDNFNQDQINLQGEEQQIEQLPQEQQIQSGFQEQEEDHQDHQIQNGDYHQEENHQQIDLDQPFNQEENFEESKRNGQVQEQTQQQEVQEAIQNPYLNGKEQKDEDQDNINVVMQQLYDELKLGEIVNPNCQSCRILEEKLLQSEYEKLNLMIQIKNQQTKYEQIEQSYQSNEQQYQNTIATMKLQLSQLSSIITQHNLIYSSGQIGNNFSNIDEIDPQQLQNSQFNQDLPINYNLQNNTNNPILNNSNNQNTNNEAGEGEDMLNRIEGLMTELTRLMENLESMQNNVTNNITCQLSNTTNTNNQTHQLLNSNNLNFNNTFTNILGGSQNTSSILPRTFINQNTSNNFPTQSQTLPPQQLLGVSSHQHSSHSSNKKSKKNKQQQQQQQQQQLQQLLPQQIFNQQSLQQQHDMQQQQQLQQQQQQLQLFLPQQGLQQNNQQYGMQEIGDQYIGQPYRNQSNNSR